MALTLYTARLGFYRGADLLDITRGSGRGDGLAFAPSGGLLWPTLRERRRGGLAWAAAWAAYVPAYNVEMMISAGKEVRINAAALSVHPVVNAEAVAATLEAHARARGVVSQPEAWARLLARDVVSIACACDGSRCHRYLLANILVSMGATYEGERVND
jgi:hypothetical protein